ncbi:DUF2249 domain-containing protein [Oleiharenicola sp. Vm1]|uniref:DUF2249 domain-containing protein n=1 Tax=Oleiharenicola sp. Vm1 TaxID=3398393 RepID=UPI0039F599A0
METPPADVLDVRPLPCARKHTLIFRRWSAVPPGGSLLLVNDHRPEPLRRQFEQLVPGCFAWAEVPPPPRAFAVRLTRLRADPPGFDPDKILGCGLAPDGVTADEDAVLVRVRLDYRELPAAEARARSERLARGLDEAAELAIDLPRPDPELDRALTALGLTFRGAALPPDSPGWRYLIRHPVRD